MALSAMSAGLKNLGDFMSDKVSTLTEKVPAIKIGLQYAQEHPWVSLGASLGVYTIYKFITSPRDLPPGNKS